MLAAHRVSIIRKRCFVAELVAAMLAASTLVEMFERGDALRRERPTGAALRCEVFGDADVGAAFLHSFRKSVELCTVREEDRTGLRTAEPYLLVVARTHELERGFGNRHATQSSAKRCCGASFLDASNAKNSRDTRVVPLHTSRPKTWLSSAQLNSAETAASRSWQRKSRMGSRSSMARSTSGFVPGV